jgi:hypothetical protein
LAAHVPGHIKFSLDSSDQYFAFYGLLVLADSPGTKFRFHRVKEAKLQIKGLIEVGFWSLSKNIADDVIFP